MQLKNQKDFFTGLLFMGTGAGFAWNASRYPVGDAAHMGPGYFALLLGSLLTLLGGVLVFKALVLETEDGGRIAAWAWRPLLAVPLAIVLLGMLLARAWPLDASPRHMDSLPGLPSGFVTMGNTTTLLHALCDPWLQRLLQGLGPVEQCTVLLLVLLAAVTWAARPVFKVLGMLLLGLLLGLVGPDGASGLLRFTLDWTELGAGIDLAALALGLQGGAAIIRRMGAGVAAPARHTVALNLRQRWLYPALLLLCSLGLYSLGQRSFDLWLLAASVLAGYALHALELAPAPLLLGFVLGPQMEDHLRLALGFSGGDWSVFFTRPLSAGMLASGVALVLLLPWLKPWGQRALVRLKR